MTRRLTSRFRSALHLSLATRRDVARAVQRGYRSLQALERGERRVTPAAARALAGYLRERAARFERAAEQLEAAAHHEEGK